MAEVMKFVDSKTTTAVPWAMPPILCGDMNEHRSGDVIQYACGQHAVSGGTSPIAMVDALADNKGIDYVLLGSAGPDRAGCVESAEVMQDDRFGDWPSDHPAVVVTLRFAVAGSNTAML